MSYPLLNVFWTMLWFFLWMMWLFMVSWILFDIFRSHDIGGWTKAGWTLLVIFLPLIGILIYVIVRGDSLASSEARRNRPIPVANAAGVSRADELSRLAELRDQGLLSDAEFEREKGKVLY